MDQQRILFEGKTLRLSKTLRDYGIASGSTLDLVLQLRGMISCFTSSDETDALVQFLMGKRKKAPLQHLRAKAKREGANEFQTYLYKTDCGILNPGQRMRLCDFMDFMWRVHNDNNESEDSDEDEEEDPRTGDMKLVLLNQHFLDLLGDLEVEGDPETRPKTALRMLKRAFYNIPSSRPRESNCSKLALRHTVGPTNACINFHCDGPYATSTTQIALNEPSDYDGGRLVYFVNDEVGVLDRPAGSMVQHPPRVLHAVTSLEEGTRQSLFVVDRRNGLGESEVLEVTSQHVQSFFDNYS